MDAQLADNLDRGFTRLEAVFARLPPDSLSIRTNPGVLLNLAAAYISVGRLDRARALMAEYERAVPDSSRRAPELSERLRGN
ncbi:MAG: hypothetical protein A2W29_03450 [Gemmatimonadetes bacterium RBG_16_66_8]|nr:MAG: hypothetical protein A2W29_03450 [Gemmatimonadetes bacterium RBG_16_66_8]